MSDSTKKQFGILKKLMVRGDVTSLVEATDAGREGELIFRLVYVQTGCKKPVERLWISSMEEEKREPILLPHFSAHHLRHTFCTRLCEQESNIKVIQSIMGHADYSTTMDIYAECSMEKQQEVFADLNGKIMIK